MKINYFCKRFCRVVAINNGRPSPLRYQHLHRNVTFIDPPPETSSDSSFDVVGGAGIVCDAVRCYAILRLGCLPDSIADWRFPPAVFF